MRNLKKIFTKRITTSTIIIFRKISFITNRFYSTIQIRMIMSFILRYSKSFLFLKYFVANVKKFFRSITNYINISKTNVFLKMSLIRKIFSFVCRTSSSISRTFLSRNSFCEKVSSFKNSSTKSSFCEKKFSTRNFFCEKFSQLLKLSKSFSLLFQTSITIKMWASNTNFVIEITHVFKLFYRLSSSRNLFVSIQNLTLFSLIVNFSNDKFRIFLLKQWRRRFLFAN